MTALVDTGVFFAFYSIKDEHHLDSLGLIVHLARGKWGHAYITNHILDETLNILKYRLGPDTAKAFLHAFIDTRAVEVIYADEEIEKQALKIFRENIERKGLSYTDAVTAATVQTYQISFLLTYDQRSFKGIIDNIVGPNYWQTIPAEERKQILKIARKHATSIKNKRY